MTQKKILNWKHLETIFEFKTMYSLWHYSLCYILIVTTDVQLTFHIELKMIEINLKLRVYPSCVYPNRKFIFAFHIYSFPSVPIHLIISSVTNSGPVVVIETIRCTWNFSTNICSSATLYCHWYFIVYMLKKNH